MWRASSPRPRPMKPKMNGKYIWNGSNIISNAMAGMLSITNNHLFGLRKKRGVRNKTKNK